MYTVKIKIISDYRAILKTRDYSFNKLTQAQRCFDENSTACEVVSKHYKRIFQVLLIDKGDNYRQLNEIKGGRLLQVI